MTLEDLLKFFLQDSKFLDAFGNWQLNKIKQQMYASKCSGLVAYETDGLGKLTGAAFGDYSKTSPNTVFIYAIVVTDGSVATLLKNFIHRFPNHNIEGLRKGKLVNFGKGETLLKRLCNLKSISV